jgi:adenylosuccinate synthase
MAGISPWVTPDLEILVCMRVYPIRVAGNSGPMHEETTWEALGLPVELTTVTRKPRRVGLWDGELAAAAIRANPGGRIHLSMLDQLPGAVEINKPGWPTITDTGWSFIDRVEKDTGAVVAVVGCGPTTADQIVLEES